MNINERTLQSIADAIRPGIIDSHDDLDIAMAALKAFVENATLSDWDELEAQKP